MLRLPDHVADVARDLLFRVLGDVRGHGAWVDRLVRVQESVTPRVARGCVALCLTRPTASPPQAGACSLIAARQSGQPVTFADVCEAVGQPAPRVAAAYRSALETLGVEVPSHDPRALATRALGAATDFAASNARGESLKSKASAAASRTCWTGANTTNFRVPCGMQFQRVLSDALWLWDLCVQFSLSEGRQPLPLAAACACVAAQHEGFADVTPAALADRLPVSASSVTSRYREVLQRLRDAARVIPWFANPTDQALVSDLRLVQSFFRLSEQLGAGQQAPSATLTEVTAAALPPVLERREAEAARVRDVVAAAARDLAAASAAPGGDVAAAEGGAVRDSGADGGRGPRPAGRSRKRQREELTIRRMLLDGVPAEEIVEAHSNARRRKRGASTEPP